MDELEKVPTRMTNARPVARLRHNCSALKWLAGTCQRADSRVASADTRIRPLSGNFIVRPPESLPEAVDPDFMGELSGGRSTIHEALRASGKRGSEDLNARRELFESAPAVHVRRRQVSA